jgi:hypothetical protein
MTERPILFSAPMVRAILEGKKMQTRRGIKDAPKNCAVHDIEDRGNGVWHWEGDRPTKFGGEVQMNDWAFDMKCPYGTAGDRLWVKETHAHCDQRKETWFASDHGPMFRPRVFTSGFLGHGINPPMMNWTPSIFMPRKLSRITLEVTAVRVERLNEISHADCLAEGVESYEFLARMEEIDSIAPPGSVKPTVFTEYRRIWEAINGAGSWEANPWVWVVTFRRINA